MTETTLTPDQLRVLEATAAVNAHGQAPSSSAVAIETGAEPGPVRTVLNSLHELGLIDESLHLTAEGEAALRS